MIGITFATATMKTPSIYPGAEGTGQGVDNNCNGLFSPSETETCSTDADNDGLCDDYDDCIGEYDNCGICNGSNLCVPGCTYPQACNFDPEADFFDFSCDFCSCLDGTEWSYIHEGLYFDTRPLWVLARIGTKSLRLA